MPNQNLLQAAAREFTKSALGPRLLALEKNLDQPDQKEEPEKERSFGEREPREQVELLYSISSLVDEKKLLTRSIKKEQKKQKESQEELSTRLMPTRVGGRFIMAPAALTQGPKEALYRKLAFEQSKERLQQINDELKKIGQIRGLHEAYEKKLETAYYFIKIGHKIDQYRARVVAIDNALEQINSEGQESPATTVTGVAAEQSKLLRKERQDLVEKVSSFENIELNDQGDPALAESQYLFRIKGYAEDFQKGYMIEFPSARATVQEILKNMRQHQPRLLIGHLGSGKTELAKHAAKIFMIENGVGYDPGQVADVDKLYQELQPEIFSGGEEASVYDLIGKLKLEPVDTTDPKKLSQEVKRIKAKLGEIKGTTLDIPEKEIALALLGKSDVVTTLFKNGPLGRALKEGKPLILDEVNRIPSEILSRLNDYLTRKVGDKVPIQENGGKLYEIKPGFAVIGTGNLGEEYNVKKLELSMKSRLPAIRVNYPKLQEVYDLIMAALVRKDRPRLPQGFPMGQYEKLADLALAVKEIQENFSGETVGLRFMSMIDRTEPEATNLKRALISSRDLMRRIVEPWKKENFSRTLDEVVANEILRAEVENKEEQKFMAEIFLRRGFFADWTSKKLKEYDIDISDQEINVLRVQMDTEEYAEANKHYEELRTKAHKQASLVKAGLMIGVRSE